MQITVEQIRQALHLSGFDGEAAQKKMMPAFRTNVRPREREGEARLGSVLLLLYCHQRQWHLLLTRRRDDLSNHAGQISLPGGGQEGDESLLETALRETHEEVGVAADGLSVLGGLTTLYISPSDFKVHPFVARIDGKKRPSFHPNPAEVAALLEAPLPLLLDPATCQWETWTVRGFQMDVPFYQVKGHKVWGATAMILSEFLERLRAVRPLATQNS